jgi:hypothetical protein
VFLLKDSSKDINDYDPVSGGLTQQQAENDDAEDVQDDAHSGTGEEDATQQHEYDVEEDDHDQQEAPVRHSPPAAPLTWSSKDCVPSTRYAFDQYVVLLSDGSETETFSDAVKYENKKGWNNAMQEEMDSLHKNHIYDLVKFPKGKKI